MTSHNPIIAEFRNNVKDITHTKESLTDPRGACIQGCYQCEKDKKVIDLFIKALTQAEARGFEKARKEAYHQGCIDTTKDDTEILKSVQEQHKEEKVAVLLETRNVALKEGFERGQEEFNDCSCKEKWTFNVVHRKNNPCYLAPRTVSDV